MDKASRTIDRHEPILPEYIQGPLTLKEEMLQTRIKNDFILRFCNVGQIKRWVKKFNPKPDPYQKIITPELLDRAAEALLKARGDLLDKHWAYLIERGITEADILKYNIVSTQKLVGYLSDDEVTNLSLRLSDKFTQFTNKAIDGVSIPYYYGSPETRTLYGFCTRILDNPEIKYSITIPQRFCFGLDTARSDYVVVVEGVFDAIPLHKQGYHSMALGDSQPNYWKMLQASKYNHIFLVFDNDYTGKLGAAKAHVILDEMLGVDPDRISIILSPEVEDSIKYFITEGFASIRNKTSLKALASHLTLLGREYAPQENRTSHL